MSDVTGPDSGEPDTGPDAVPDPDAGPSPEDSLGAPADALQRARAAARARGLRPGVKPKRRFKDMPGVGGEGRRGGRDPQTLGDELDAFVSERGWKVDVAVGDADVTVAVGAVVPRSPPLQPARATPARPRNARRPTLPGGATVTGGPAVGHGEGGVTVTVSRGRRPRTMPP